MSDRVNHLFKSKRDEKAGMPFTNTEVARMSLGDLTEDEEVVGMRTGSIPNASADKVAALARVFCVRLSFFLDNRKRPPIIDREVLDILRDETASAIAHKIHLPGREKQMILNIIQQFEEMRTAALQDAAT